MSLNINQENLSSQEETQEKLISARFVEERRRLGWNKTKTAGVAQVSGTTVTNWEKGDGLPDAGCLARLGAAGMDIMYVLTGRPDPRVTEPGATGYVTHAKPAGDAAQPGATLIAATQAQHELAIRTALLDTSRNARKYGTLLTTDQFMDVAIAMYREFLDELVQGNRIGSIVAPAGADRSNTGTDG